MQDWNEQVNNLATMLQIRALFLIFILHHVTMIGKLSLVEVCAVGASVVIVFVRTLRFIKL